MSDDGTEQGSEYKLAKIGFIMLGVEDLDRSVAFYRDKLGLEVTMQSPGFAFLGGGGVTLGLNPGLWAALGKHPGATNVVFEVASVKAAHQGLVAKGVEFLGEPINVNGPQWAANFRDPDGHLLSAFGAE